MRNNPSARPFAVSLISSVAAWTVVLLIAGLTGGSWLLLADDLGWQPIAAASALALLTFVAGAWQLTRLRARRRLLAALDAFAEREITEARAMTVLNRVRTLSTALGIAGPPVKLKGHVRRDIAAR